MTKDINRQTKILKQNTKKYNAEMSNERSEVCSIDLLGGIMVTVLEDVREIKSIHGTEEGHIWSWEVGKSCDKIECYGENGQMATVPWFAIHKNGTVMQRLVMFFRRVRCL